VETIVTGEQFRLWRISMGLRQADVAQMIGSTTAEVAGYETASATHIAGKHEPAIGHSMANFRGS
jgi:transcriptional regulator with XRE-family HTH domain